MIDERTFATKIPPWKYAEIEKKVVELYIEQGIHSFPIDPFEIIKRRGYILTPFSKFDNFNRPEVIDDNNDAFSFYVPELKTHIIVYNDDKPLFYAIIRGKRSKAYKTLGRCENFIFKNGYHNYLSENDIMTINKLTFYYND